MEPEPGQLQNWQDGRQKKDSHHTRLFIVAAVILVAGVGVYMREQHGDSNRSPCLISPAIGSPSNVGTYVNQRLGFTFAIPSGYRLATGLMQFLNTATGHPIANWSPGNTEDVVITASTESIERAFVQAGMDGRTKIDFTNVTTLPHTIYVVALGLDQTAVQNELAVPYHHVLVSDVEATRYTDLANESVVVVPYDGCSKTAAAESVRTVFLKTSNGTDSFDADAFDRVVASFSYIKT